MRRKCKACGKEGDLEDFVPYVVRGKRGRRHICYQCWNERWSPVILEHQRRYYDTNHAGLRDKVKQRSNCAYATKKEETYRRNILYEQRHPERASARQAVGIALRSGRLTKQPCEVCGAKKVDAHHDDYSKPLEVHWLCRTHHGERQRQINREKWYVS